MASTWPASKDAVLAVQAAAFAVKIAAAPTTYGFVAADATALTAASNAFTDAYALAADPQTRTAGTIAAKDVARDDLLLLLRSFGRRITGNLSITAEQRADLGLPPIDREPTPIPPPAHAPLLTAVAVSGRTVRVRFQDATTPTRRGRPEGVAGAEIYSYVGTTPPSELSEFKFEGNVTRTSADVVFPSSVPNWSKVWIVARWFNPRHQNGPTSTALEANLPGSASAAA